MKNYFITGLVLVFPFTLAILLIGWIFYILSIPFYSLFHAFFESVFLSRLLSFLSAILSVIAVGFFAEYFIVKKVVEIVHNMMKKVPFVRSVYNAAYEVVAVLSRDKSKGFSEAVLVAHPSEGSNVVGFIPRRDINLCESISKAPLIPVFIPGTVNPLMGFLIFTTAKYIKPLSISTKDAFIWTVSLGGKNPF